MESECTTAEAQPRKQITELFERLVQSASELNSQTSDCNANDSDFALQAQPVSTELIVNRRFKCVQILIKWKATAILRNQNQAKADCDFILAFIKDICR